VRFPFLDELGKALTAALGLFFAFSVVGLLVDRLLQPVEDDLGFILAPRIDGVSCPLRETLETPLYFPYQGHSHFVGSPRRLVQPTLCFLYRLSTLLAPRRGMTTPQSGEFARAAVGPSIDPLAPQPDRAVAKSRVP
jgi:hypothetical protein